MNAILFVYNINVLYEDLQRFPAGMGVEKSWEVWYTVKGALYPREG